MQQSSSNVRVVLVGKSGQGKSTLGNKILGLKKEVFRVSTSFCSQTTNISSQTFTWPYNQNLRVDLVDTPGLADNSERLGLSDCEILENIEEYITGLKQGFDVALYCWQAKSCFDKTDLEELQMLGDMLTANVFDQIQICVTQVDDLTEEKKEQIMQSLERDLVYLFEQHRIQIPIENILVADFRDFENSIMKPIDKIMKKSEFYKVPDVRVILVGKSGQGKSTLGNKILNMKEVFKVGHGLKSETCRTESQVFPWPYNQNLQVDLVDTPGLADNTGKTGLSDDKILENIEEYITGLKQGFNVALYCWQAKKRFDKTDLEELRTLGEMLTHNVFQKMWICVTQVDDMKPEQRYQIMKNLEADLPLLFKQHKIQIPTENILIADFKDFENCMMKPLDQILKTSKFYDLSKIKETRQEMKERTLLSLIKMLREETGNKDTAEIRHLIECIDKLSKHF